MGVFPLEFWEPEETVGKAWHDLATGLAPQSEYPEEAVAFAQVEKRLGVFFRACGGDPSVEIRPVRRQICKQRMTARQKAGHAQLAVQKASFDGGVLRLPQKLSVFPNREANGALYLWLVAMAAHMECRFVPEDNLQADLAALAMIGEAQQEAVLALPGLLPLFSEFRQLTLLQRGQKKLQGEEAAIEEIVRDLLGQEVYFTPLAKRFASCLACDCHDKFTALRSYRPFGHVPIWVYPQTRDASAADEVESAEADAAKEVDKQGIFKAKRRKADQANRSDSFILHKFEAILSWAEFLNLNRRIDDDDHDDAKKAADDQEEISLGQVSKAPATRLKLHLDLAPEDVDRERLSSGVTYPEWDMRTNTYLANHCRVLESDVVPGDREDLTDDPARRKRIETVRRQFEALYPGRTFLPGQTDGEELDLEAAVRARCDFLAGGETTDAVWRQMRKVRRDLAVSILLDTSRSTESSCGQRSVIEVEREALAALAWGLDACGDDFAVNAFSSLKRDRVYFSRCKRFDEPMSTEKEAAIESLKPGFYTRMGAAIRHASSDLAKQGRSRRLILVITDGKPNDLDHYEGRHGIEDTRMAIHEARMAGHIVYGIAVEKEAQRWFPRMFGAGRYCVIADPNRLVHALPAIYRQLVTG